jgi:hypothetical protein
MKDKDRRELENEKNSLINDIKKIKKEDILPPPPKKLTLWQKLKRVLLGL